MLKKLILLTFLSLLYACGENSLDVEVDESKGGSFADGGESVVYIEKEFLALADQTFQENQIVSLAPEAAESYQNCKLVEGSENEALFAQLGLSLNPETCEINGTITSSALASSTFWIEAENKQTGAIEYTDISFAVETPVVDYTTATQHLTVDSAGTITPVVQDFGSALISCVLAPGSENIQKFPSTLTLNSDCSITGTPSTALATTTFTVIGTNANGAGNPASFVLKISAIAPELSYTNPVAIAVGDTVKIPPSLLDDNGSELSDCFLDPTDSNTSLFPTGLSLNKNNCYIEGSSNSSLALTSFKVIAQNGAGQANAINLNLSVAAAAAPELTFNKSQLYFSVGETFAIAPDLLNEGNQATTCSLDAGSDPLPAGVTLDANSCTLSGSITGTYDSSTIIINATNASGTSQEQFDLAAGTGAISSYSVPEVMRVGDAISLDPSLSLEGATVTGCSATSLPAGLSINSSTCQISGTLTTEASGSYEITLVTSNGTSVPYILDVDVLNSLPELDYGVTNYALSKGSSANITAVTLNDFGEAIFNCYEEVSSGQTSTLYGLGLSVNPNTCAITGTPFKLSATKSYKIVAQNSVGKSAVVSVSIGVTSGVPLLSYDNGKSAPLYTFDVGSVALISPLILGDNGSNITGCSLNGGSNPLPVGLSINSSCEISGTASEAQSSTTHTVKVTNGNGSTTASFTLQVNATAPQINYSATNTLVASLGNALSVTPETLKSGGSPITDCKLKPGSPNIADWPAEFFINTSTCEISGTRSTVFSPKDFTIVATNALGDSQGVIINFSVTATAPTLAYSNPNSTSINQPFSLTPTTLQNGGDPIVTCSLKSGDANNDFWPTGLSINATTCAISGTPTSALSSTTFKVVASNSIGASSAANFTLEIVTASPPELGYASTKYNGRIGIATNITPSTLNANGGTISCALDTGSPVLPAGLSVNSSTCAIEGTPSANSDYATYTVKVTTEHGSQSATFDMAVGVPILTFDVSSVNDSVGNPITITPSFVSGNGVAITSCSTTPALPSGFSISNTTCEISGTASSSFSQLYSVTALNSVGSSLPQSLNLVISNAAPILEYYPKRTAMMGSSIKIAPSKLDNKGFPITSCSIKSGSANEGMWPSWASINASTCEITGIPDALLSETEFTFVATSTVGTSADYKMKLEVTNCNDNVPVGSERYFAGDGTSGNPYQICNYDQLANLSATSGDWVAGTYFKLISDIIAPVSSSFTPIATGGVFYGVFDGNGYAIRDLNINLPASNYIGLFSNINGVTISNLKIDNATVVGYDRVGVLAGNATSSTLNQVTVINSSVDGNMYTGGVIGIATISNFNNLALSGSTINGSSRTGGTIGQASGGSLSQSYFSGTVVGSSSSTGGLVGLSYNNFTLSESYSAGSVSGTTDVGGLVGNDSSTGTTTISDCYSSATVTGSSHYVGGLVGHGNNSTTTRSFFVGSADSSIGTNDGGITGYTVTGISNSFYDSSACGSGCALAGSGVGQTTARMQDWVTFVNDDFDFSASGPWAMPSSGGYPVLAWQAGAVKPSVTFGGGDGSFANPYLISTPEHFNSIALDSSNWSSSKHYQLTTNLDFTGKTLSISGDATTSFQGVFDANNKTISNVTINATYRNRVALFGRLENASITNLTLDNFNVTGADWVGALVGEAVNTSLSNITLTNSTLTGGTYVGGLVGAMTTNSALSNLALSGNTVNGQSQTGGIVGHANGGTLSQSYFSGTVVGSSGNTGGLVGLSFNNFVLSEGYSVGNISGASYVGGLVGLDTTSGTTTISDCYSSATVTGSSNYVGGLVGSGNSSTTTRSFFVGSADSTIGTFDGGITGLTVTGISKSFYDSSACGSGCALADSGVAQTTARMQDWVTFANNGFDFSASGPWAMPSGGGYPVLAWQAGSVKPSVTFGGGDGSVGNPYLIGTPEHFNSIVLEPANWSSATHFQLTANLDFTGKSLAIIGTASTPFQGVFDANNKTLSNITLDASFRDNVGIFGKIQNNSLSNLTLDNVTVTGGDFTGALAGEVSNATISNITLSNSTITGGTYVGGLLGLATTSSLSTLTSSISTINGLSRTGGIIGQANSGSLIQSYFNGTVVGSSSSTGGLIGVSYNNFILSESYSAGSVSGATDVGGLVGNDTSSGTTTISDCYSSATVTGSSNYVGGLVGHGNNSTTTRSFFVGSADSTIGTFDGGITGFTVAGISNSLYDVSACGLGCALAGSGVAETTARMQDWVTFVNNGFDFSSSGPWAMPSGGGYPVLAWQAGSVKPSVTFGGGDGSSGSPYIISTADHFNSIALDSSNWTTSIHFDLSANLDFTGKEFAILGNNTTPFEAIFNGNSQTISNVTMSTSQNYAGIFGYLKNSNITNLNLDNISITGVDYVGALAGYIDTATISNVNVTNITINGNSYIGALAGYAKNSMLQNISAISAINNTSHFAGGLIGYGNGTTITEVFTNVTLTASVVNNLGGIAGYLTGSSIDKSGSYANLITTGSGFVGGVAGNISNSSSVTRVYSHGSISGNSYVGGVVGYVSTTNSSVSDSYSNANVTGTSSYVGGVIGRTVSSTVSNLYYAGSLVDGSGSNEGALVGVGSFSTSYWDGTLCSGCPTGNAVQSTTANMATNATTSGDYTGWDTTNDWYIIDGKYPSLKFSVQSATEPKLYALFGLSINQGMSNIVIDRDFIWVEDYNDISSNVTFTVTTVPANGDLTNNGITMNANDTFTLDDLNSGKIKYTHTAGNSNDDSFAFWIQDDEFEEASNASMASPVTFNIEIL